MFRWRTALEQYRAGAYGGHSVQLTGSLAHYSGALVYAGEFKPLVSSLRVNHIAAWNAATSSWTELDGGLAGEDTAMDGVSVWALTTDWFNGDVP